MRKILLAVFLFGCGSQAALVSPHDVAKDPDIIVEGAEYYGEHTANSTKKFVRQNDEGWIKAKDHTGKKANEARKYFYERGLKDARHGSKQGEAGAAGATGSQGPQGEQGIAGDAFDGDARLSDLEDRVAALEAMDAAFETALAFQATASDLADQELADDISSLTDHVTTQIQRLDRRISRVNRRSVRAIRSLSNYVDYELAQLAVMVAGNSVDLAQIASSIASIEAAVATLEAAEDETCSVNLQELYGPWVRVTITCGDDITKFRAFEN